MNLFSNLFVSLFMATGSSFSAMEETFSTKQENVLELKEKNSFTYIAGSTGIYPSPGFAIGRRTKSLHHAQDVSISLSCIPVIESFDDLTSSMIFIQGYANCRYYMDWGSKGAYHGPGIGVGSLLPLHKKSLACIYNEPMYCIMGASLKPSYTIGKEYETYFHQLDLSASVYIVPIVLGIPAVIPMITYEIGFKF